MFIGTLPGQVEEIDLNSMKTVQQYGSGICQPKERRRRARLANLPVARRRRLDSRVTVSPPWSGGRNLLNT